MITAGSSPFHIASSGTRIENHWFPSTSHKPLSYAACSIPLNLKQDICHNILFQKSCIWRTKNISHKRNTWQVFSSELTEYLKMSGSKCWWNGLQRCVSPKIIFVITFVWFNYICKTIEKTTLSKSLPFWWKNLSNLTKTFRIFMLYNGKVIVFL